MKLEEIRNNKMFPCYAACSNEKTKVTVTVIGDDMRHLL